MGLFLPARRTIAAISRDHGLGSAIELQLLGRPLVHSTDFLTPVTLFVLVCYTTVVLMFPRCLLVRTHWPPIRRPVLSKSGSRIQRRNAIPGGTAEHSPPNTTAQEQGPDHAAIGRGRVGQRERHAGHHGDQHGGEREVQEHQRKIGHFG